MTARAPEIDVAAMDPSVRYRLLSGLVVPRPIAWIATRSTEGRVNLAPFSFFNVVCTDPALLAVSIDDRDEDEGPLPEPVAKDTLRNLLDTGECAVHVVDEAMLDQTVVSAIPFPPDESEPAAIGTGWSEWKEGGVPYLPGSPAALRCRLDRHLRLGPATTMVLLAPVAARVRADVWVDGRVEPGALAAVGRMASPAFVRTRDRLIRPVPGYREWRSREAAASPASTPSVGDDSPARSRKPTT